VRILCRDKDDFGAVVDRPGQVGDTRLPAGEHRLHLNEVTRLILAGAEVVSGPLEQPVSIYLASVEDNALSRHLFGLKAPKEARPVLLELAPRGRYLVTHIQRSHGRRGTITQLDVVDRRAPSSHGWVSLEAVVRRILTPPGATFFVDAGERLLPVTLRLTTHDENQIENDLIALAGCKGRWGRLEES